MAHLVGQLEQLGDLRPPSVINSARYMLQQEIDVGVEEILLQQHRQIGAQGGQQFRDEDPIGEEIVDIDAMPPQKFLLEQRQIALHGVVVFAQRHKGRIACREGGFDALEKFALPVLIDAQGAEDFINGQVRQQAFRDHALAFGLGKGFLREAFQGAEQPGGELVDAKHDRLRLIVGDGAQQAALLREEE